MFKMFKLISKYFSKDSFIEITDIIKTENILDVKFKTSEDINRFLKEKYHFIEYLKFDFDLRNCPDGVCVIPAVSNLLPIVWFFDLKLIVDELDKNFYESIDEIKKGYQQMYPFVDFNGKIVVKNIIDYSYDSQDNSILLFSQGLDSLNSFVNHIDENLHLTTIHGSDIPLDKTEGFDYLSRQIDEFALKYNCENSFIRSNFRRCMNYPVLDKSLPEPMIDSWWHQLQHGIGILSHAVVMAYLKKSKCIYIASSHSESYANSLGFDYVRCASSPIIDNQFKFASCKIVHDGYEYRRIDKLENIVDFSRSHETLKLRVCFTSRDGSNCSICEKCARSIFGLISMGEDPNEYGFNVDEDRLKLIKHNLDYLKTGKEKKGWRQNNYRPYYWINIQKNFQDNRDEFEDNETVNWIFDYDFLGS